MIVIDPSRHEAYERLSGLYSRLGLIQDARRNDSLVPPSNVCSFCTGDVQATDYGCAGAWLCDSCRREGTRVFEQTTIRA